MTLLTRLVDLAFPRHFSSVSRQCRGMSEGRNLASEYLVGRAFAFALCLTLIGCTGADGAVTTSSSQPTATSTSSISTTTTSVSTTTSAPASTSTTSAAALEGTTIVLDPGHNGMNWAHPEEINEVVDIGNGTKACNTTGTSTDDGYAEAEFNWEVAVLARSRLEALGATVLLTRVNNEGWGPCITERAAIGNRAGADAVVSIHADGGTVEGRGFHVIHPAVVEGLTDDIAQESLRLAHALHRAYQKTGMPTADYIANGGFSERDDLGGLNLSDVPVVFLEAGNMRNGSDAALLTDPAFRARIADAIVRALLDFLRN